MNIIQRTAVQASTWLLRSLNISIADLDKWIDLSQFGPPTSTGLTVNEQTALRSSAVFACVRILAEDISSLPLPVYRRLQGRGKERATDFHLYDVLQGVGNEEMSAMTLRETLQGHVALWGNAYAEIQRNNGGRIIGLWPLRPDRTKPVRLADGRLVYVIRLPNGEDRTLSRERVFHLVGFGFDGLKGYSPIAMAREAIGLALATEKYGGTLFKNNARPGGYYEHPQKLSDEAYERLKASLEDQHRGLEKAHRIGLLEEGMKFQEVGIPPEDAQFLETRKFQTVEIARIYRMPPHKIGDLERATFSNIEQQSIDYVVGTLRPWLRRWEQAISFRLLTTAERRTFFAEHLVEGLLRGDTQSRYQAYALGRQWGWFSANDIREKENENPIPDGDVYLQPLNMVPAGTVRDENGNTRTNWVPTSFREVRPGQNASIKERALRSAATRQRIGQSYRRVLADAEARIVRRERNDVMRQAKKMLARRDAPQFLDWLNEFFFREHPPYMEDQYRPGVTALADAVQAEANEEIGQEPGMTPDLEEFTRAYVATMTARRAASSRSRLQRIVREAETDEAALEQLGHQFETWEEERPEDVARNETVQASNAVAKAVFIAGGITALRWVNTGSDNCPYCRSLDGTTVGVNSNFVSAGQPFQPDGAERPLSPSSNIGNPPLHDGCDCVISPTL